MRDEIEHLVVGVTDLGESFAVHDFVEYTRRSKTGREIVRIVLAIVVPLDQGAAVFVCWDDEVGANHCVDQSVVAVDAC